MAYITRSNTAIQSTSTLPSHLPTSSATSTLERVPDPLSYEEEDEEEDHIVLVPTPTGSAVRNGTTSYIEGVGRSGGSQKRMLLTEVTTTLSLSLSQSEGEEDMEEDEYEEDAMEEDEEPPTQGTEDSGAPLYSPGGGEYRPDGIVTFGGGSSEQGDARMTESEDEFDASEEQRHVDEDDEDVEEEVEEEEEEEEEEEDGYEDDGEREAIQYEMQSLTDTVPVINGRYKLIDRLGEGQSLVSLVLPWSATDAHMNRDVLVRLQGRRPTPFRIRQHTLGDSLVPHPYPSLDWRARPRSRLRHTSARTTPSTAEEWQGVCCAQEDLCHQQSSTNIQRTRYLERLEVSDGSSLSWNQY
jgi:hypothetical protein